MFGLILHKGLVSGWDERWVVCGFGHLEWYKQRGDSKPAGSIDLNKATIELHVDGNPQTAFSLKDGIRVHIFCCASMSVYSEWTAEIRACMPGNV